jgi:hypothetical protein
MSFDERQVTEQRETNRGIKSIADQLKEINFGLESLGKLNKDVFKLQKEQKEGQEANKRELQGIGKALKNQAQNDQKQRLAGIGKSLREGITGSLKSVGEVTAKSIKSVLGKLKIGDLIKGLGLFTLLTNPEAFAKGIKSIAEAVMGLVKVITSDGFKKGMEALFDFVVQVGKFGIDRVSQLLDGIAGVSKGFKDLLEGGIFNVDWKDFAGDIGNVALGLGGLALIVAPGAVLSTGLKLISGSVKLIANSIGPVATGMGKLAGIFASPVFASAAMIFGAGAGAYSTEMQLNEERQTGVYGPATPENGKMPGWLQLFLESIRRGGMAFQKGNLVPGSGNGDTVPAMLEPGEYVLNKNLVKAMGINNLNAMNFGMVPRFQTGGEVVEYLTGDRSHSNYRADHGGGNYHEHVAFSSRAQRDAAIRALENAGFTVGSTDRYRPGSYHHVGQALDVPLYPNLQNLGYSDDKAGEEQFSADVRRALGAAGFAGSGISATASPTPDTTPSTYTVSGVQYDMATGASINPQTGQPRTQPYSIPTSSASTTPTPTNLLAGLTSAINLGPFAQMFDVLKGLVNTSGLTSLLSGSPAAAAGMSSTYTGTTASTSAPGSAKQMYSYIKSLGYSDAQAKGLVANIQRESSFRLDAVGDNGNSFGLFQWNRPAGRADRMMNAVPDWKTNWKAQIDYALREDVGPQYKSATAQMTAQQAADWWMRRWERSAHPPRDSARHAEFLPTYQFKTGGLVPMRNPNAQGGGYSMKTTPSAQSNDFQTLSRQSRASGLYALAGNSQPIIIPVPVGGGNNSSGSADGTGSAPALPAAPRSAVSADYISRVSMGITLS